MISLRNKHKGKDNYNNSGENQLTVKINQHNYF
jgi:hypothetical protein